MVRFRSVKIPALGRFVLVAVAIAGFFFYLAGFGLNARLGFDDVMNLTFAWEPTLRELLLAVPNPATHIYRPTGALLYRLIFDAAGLNSFAFRNVFYAILCLNLLLVYLLARKVSESAEVGALSALLFAFHGRLSGIYTNNGTLYDVLCALIVLVLLLYYAYLPERFSVWQGTAVVALFILALNAKEMAAFG
jgi:hypothetical protein